jgi:hypothetical protein
MQQQPAPHELLHVNELLRIHSCDVEHTVNTLSTVQDPQLRQLLQTCAQTGRQHIQDLMAWCTAHNVLPQGGMQ